jgi:hypothetical protein
MRRTAPAALAADYIAKPTVYGRFLMRHVRYMCVCVDAVHLRAEAVAPEG